MLRSVKTLRLFATAFLFALLLSPLPAQAAALEKMNGVWIFDAKATFAETPGLEEAMRDELTATPPQVRLILNVAEQTIQLLLSELDEDDAVDITVIRETEDEACIGVQGMPTILKLTGKDSLRMGPDPNAGFMIPPLHFSRAPK